MTDEDWILLHRAMDRISLPNDFPDELMSWMARQPPEDHPNRAEWDRLADLRGSCRFCGTEHPESYMLQRPGLWDAVAPKLVKLDDGTEYVCSSGWVCIACLAERTSGHRLYREDFVPPGLEDELYAPAGEIAFAEEKGAEYTLCFPSQEESADQTVNLEIMFFGDGEWTDVDWDAAYDAVFDATDWLRGYCHHLGWKLIIDGMEEDLSEPEEATE